MCVSGLNLYDILGSLLLYGNELRAQIHLIWGAYFKQESGMGTNGDSEVCLFPPS
jgi:hypothetical protein